MSSCTCSRGRWVAQGCGDVEVDGDLRASSVVRVRRDDRFSAGKDSDRAGEY